MINFQRMMLGFELAAEAAAGIQAVESGGPQYESPAVVVDKNVEILVVVRRRGQTQPAVSLQETAGKE